MKGILISSTPQTSKQGRPYLLVESVFPDISTTPIKLYVWNCPQVYPVNSLLDTGTAELKKSVFGYSIPYSSLVITQPSYSDFESLHSQLLPWYTPEVSLPSEEDLVSLAIDLGLNTHPFFPVLKQAINDLYPLYLKAPAAKTHHHAFPGGLLLHTFETLHYFRHLYLAIPYSVDKFIIFFSLFLHDFGKTQEYSVSETDSSIDYTSSLYLFGHPFLSTQYFITTYAPLLPPNYVNNISHCILSHHGTQEHGSPVSPSTPEAFFVHICDLLSGIGDQYNRPNGSTLNTFDSKSILHKL